MLKISRGISPAALVISILALALATTTGAWAGAKIGTKQLRNSSVTSVKIKDQTIQGQDLAESTRAELRGQTGPQGPKGSTGPTGPAGMVLGAAYVPWTAEFTNWMGGSLAKPSVKKIGTGKYCLSGPGWEYRTDRMFVVQPDNTGGQDWTVIGSSDGHYSNQCGSYDGYLVVIFTKLDGTYADANFNIARLS